MPRLGVDDEGFMSDHSLPVKCTHDMHLKMTRSAAFALTFGLVSTCLASDAWADCSRVHKTVFSCTTPKGKVIELCDTRRELEYRYGTPGAYEVQFRIPRTLAATNQWKQTGRYQSYSVELPAGNADYTVFWSTDRESTKPRVDAGVLVEVDGRHVATLICSERHPITQEMEGIDLPSLEAEQ